MEKDIKTRTTVRTFLPKPVPENIMHEILKAGMSAPSGCGRYPVRYMILKDKKILEEISSLPGKMAILSSTLNILLLADVSTRVSDDWQGLWPLDCSAAMENILLEAHFNGLGGVWGGIYPNEGCMKAVKKLLHLPDHIIPFAVAMLGYPDTEIQPRHPCCHEDWLLDERQF